MALQEIQTPEGDVRLIQRAAQGDEDAFAQLFDYHYQSVYHYALWMAADPDVAEDVAQETFIRAHNNLHRLGPPYKIRPWLYRLARNLFIDQRRRDNPVDSLDPDAPIASPEPTPEYQITFGELSSPVTIALGRLPTSQREALVLREIEGFQYAEIAEVMGVSLDNVKVVLHRARNSFKDHYALRILAEDPLPRCEVLGDLLDTFVDGEHLTPEEDRLVREHIKQCDTCQQRKRELAAMLLLLRGIKLPSPRHSHAAATQLMPKMHRAPTTQPVPKPGKSKSGGKAWFGVGGVVLLALILGGVAFAGFKVFGPPNNPTPTEESTSEPKVSGGQADATPSATPPIAGVQSDPCGDGICTPGKEDNASCPKDCPPVSQGPYCGSVCASDADCAGLGVNPACAGGYCYDAQACGGATTSGDDGGTTTGGGSSGGSGSAPVCGPRHCPNRICEPWCGEDVVTCPRDC